MTPLWERSELRWHPQALPAVDETALRDLQAGILRHHGRQTGLAVYVRFLSTPTGTEKEAGIGWVRRMRPYVTSAWDELVAWSVRLYPPGKTPYSQPDPMVVMALSAAGLKKMKRDSPEEQAIFAGGMRSRHNLNDAPAGWEAPFDRGIDGLALLAADTPDQLYGLFRALFASRPDLGAQVVGVEELSLMWNAQTQSIEHFGFVDGRSQPRYLTFDRFLEEQSEAVQIWSSSESLDSLLVPDWLSGVGGAGSFLVLRKLEQRVRAFKEAEQALADRLDLEPDVAGSLLVGRDRSGRPAGAGTDDSTVPVRNGFLHADACPVAAHIRVMNPRDPYRPRQSMLARRGMPYGRRPIHPDDAVTLEDYPEGGVGLMFMANLSRFELFEELQERANGGDGGPVDPISGQPIAVPRQNWVSPDGGQRANLSIGGYVRMLGGEYLYMPSLSGLSSF